MDNSTAQQSTVAQVQQGENYLYYWPQPYYSWPYYSLQDAPRITRFRGSVKTLDKLPKAVKYGDAYHVESPGTLVVRVTGGWHHCDRS